MKFDNMKYSNSMLVAGLMFLTAPLYGAIAAEPYTANDLYAFGAKDVFNPTTKIMAFPLGMCSASRVRISDDDPVDFYVTAEHCINRQCGVLLDLHIEPLVYAQPAFRYDAVVFPEKDLALFTTGKKTDYPRYDLYKGEDIEKNAVSVGYGGYEIAQYLPPFFEEKQAFEVKSYKEKVEDGIFEAVFLPSMGKVDHGFPSGSLTPGDSGGSFLVKDKKSGEWLLRGVPISGFSSFVELGRNLGEIPDSFLKTNKGRACQRLAGGKTAPIMFFHCYGHVAQWSKVDLNFVEQAKEILLNKKTPFFWVDRKVSMGKGQVSLELDNVRFCDELSENVVGYVSHGSMFNVVVGGNVIYRAPAYKEGSYEFYRLFDGQDYLVKVDVEARKQGEGFEAKLTVVNQCQDYEKFDKEANSAPVFLPKMEQCLAGGAEKKIRYELTVKGKDGSELISNTLTSLLKVELQGLSREANGYVSLSENCFWGVAIEVTYRGKRVYMQGIKDGLKRNEQGKFLENFTFDDVLYTVFGKAIEDKVNNEIVWKLYIKPVPV